MLHRSRPRRVVETVILLNKTGPKYQACSDNSAYSVLKHTFSLIRKKDTAADVCMQMSALTFFSKPFCESRGYVRHEMPSTAHSDIKKGWL